MEQAVPEVFPFRKSSGVAVAVKLRTASWQFSLSLTHCKWVIGYAMLVQSAGDSRYSQTPNYDEPISPAKFHRLWLRHAIGVVQVLQIPATKSAMDGTAWAHKQVAETRHN